MAECYGPAMTASQPESETPVIEGRTDTTPWAVALERLEPTKVFGFPGMHGMFDDDRHHETDQTEQGNARNESHTFASSVPDYAEIASAQASATIFSSTAIGVVARQTRVGTQADQVWHGAPTLDGLAIIDVIGGVGRPARSYLVYKVLGDPHAAGDRMPSDAPLSSDELASLSLWIRNGAPTE